MTAIDLPLGRRKDPVPRRPKGRINHSPWAKFRAKKLRLEVAEKAHRWYFQSMSFGSAFGQDRWVIDEVFQGKKNGFFIEAGALDGVNESNTIRLEQEYGWNGLCVEPSSGYFRALRRQRQCVCENLCLFDSETKVEFIEAGGHGGIPSYFSKDYLQRGKRVFKPAVRLETLLDKHGAPPIIDYLSLDTEGSEYIILKNFPFNRYRILALTIEHNDNPAVRDSLTQLLSSRGYVLVRSVLVDDWWLDQSLYEALPEERKAYWKLQDKFLKNEVILRAEETYEKYKELQRMTLSIPGTASQLFRLFRKRLQGKPVS